MQDCINIYNSGVLAVSIDQVIDSLYSDRITGELTLSFTSKVERIPEITGDTLIEFRGQYFRAVQVQYSAADGEFLLTVSCEQETMTLVDDELPLFEFSGTPGAALASLLSGTGISGTSEYTDTIQLKEENTNRRAVMIVIRGMAGGEIEYVGHTVRIVKHRGRTEPRKLIGLMQCTDIARNVDLQAGTESFEITGWKPGDFGVGDEVMLDFAPLNANTQRRIIGISYNPFNCTSVSVEVGDFVPDILDSYREVIEDSEEANGRLDKIDEEIGDTVKKSELSAGIDTYINEERGRASIVAALKGTYVEPDALTGYTKKTELSAEIGAYIDTQAGTAKIVNKLTGTFVKTDALGNYVAKSDLSAGIESYIDTEAGTAKVVSAISGTYVTQSGLTGTLGNYAQKGDIPDVSGFVEKTELSTEIGAYIDTQAGTAKIVDKLTGTFVKTDALGNYVAKSDLSAGIESYIDTSTGQAKLVSAVSGTYVTQSGLTGTLGNYAKKDDIPDVSGFVEKTELSAEIGAYIDTQAGTAKIVDKLTGTFVKTDALGNYVAKSDLSAGIESYIDTSTGQAKLVSAVSGTYQKKSDMSGYVTTANLNTSIGQYIDTSAGTAKIISAASGTYQKKSDMSGYVTTTNLNTSIGQYIDSTAGTAKIVSAVSGEYATKNELSGYATTSALSEISQTVSDVKADITLSTSYTKDTIGTNVQALLQLVSNPNSSAIKIKADKIDFTGFTTFLRASDLGASGATTIDGGRITTGTISADRIDVSNLKVNTIYGKGAYSSYTAMTTDSTSLYIGGASFSASYSNIYLAAKTKIYFGSTGIFEICVDMSSDSIYSTYSASLCGTSSYPWGEIHGGGNNSYHIVMADTVVRPSANNAYQNNSLGTSSYPWNAVYAKAIYLNGTALSTGANPDLAGSTVKLGGSTSYYIVCNTSRELRPYSTSTTYPCYLGTSSYYWHYAYIGSNTASIGSSGTSKLGFFGTTPATRQTVSNTATVATLITALKKYGLIA